MVSRKEMVQMTDTSPISRKARLFSSFYQCYLERKLIHSGSSWLQSAVCLSFISLIDWSVSLYLTHLPVCILRGLRGIFDETWSILKEDLRSNEVAPSLGCNNPVACELGCVLILTSIMHLSTASFLQATAAALLEEALLGTVYIPKSTVGRLELEGGNKSILYRPKYP